MENYKPFKQYREMDDTQKRKISDNPHLHLPKPDSVKKKISQTMKGRWAATPSRNPNPNGIKAKDLVF